MSDEVTQAAERLRRWNSVATREEADRHEYASGTPECCEPFDRLTVSEAYLSEHAAADETANENATRLTADILQASGWVRCGSLKNTFSGPVPYLVLMNCVSSFDVAHITENDMGERLFDVVCHIETVGDLRKLLDALHIDAVVVVQNGGE